MVHNPTVGTVQVTEFSKLSAQSAPFVYFDGVVTAGITARFSSNWLRVPLCPHQTARRQGFMS
jgi:hypothetical protein